MSPVAKTPVTWRAVLLGFIVLLTTGAYFSVSTIGPRGQAAAGIVCFLSLAAACSQNLRAVNWKTIGWGVALQFLFAVLVLYVKEVRSVFEIVGEGIKTLISSSDKGAEFVFGSLAKFDGPAGFVFAFKALPPIIFVSSFFSVLYYLGVLQLLVRGFAVVMRYMMGTSGAETLSVAANVFMGQTEAPLIVKPFIPKMTKSELLALMGSGMAHISGGMMAVYISYGADPVSILCTCVMACPCSLYLTKLLLPETETPETLGGAKIHVDKQYSNVIDAAAGGVKDGLFLALNVAAMLIGFLAFIALFDAMIGGIKPLLLKMNVPAEMLANWPDNLNLQTIFGWVFSPVAFLLGVDPAESNKVGSLLGIKLAANEHVAYLQLKEWKATPGYLSPRSQLLSVYALSGFANFASIGIQLGGIGAMAEGRKADLAKLGMRALFIGFLTTLINAAVAGLLMGDAAIPVKN
ncbi:MAG: nucleoside transporter C-terminal domain-containing protein [Gemmataceae bacterium]